jgi:hypothetical protein
MLTSVQIRSIYRVAEFAEGVGGYAFNHEWLFWVFESVPMAIVIYVYCVFFPNKVLGPDASKRWKAWRKGAALGEEGMASELSDRR